jgi:hypothetical protein
LTKQVTHAAIPSKRNEDLYRLLTDRTRFNERPYLMRQAEVPSRFESLIAALMIEIIARRLAAAA